MAAIDRIYGTNAQYSEFHQWCRKHCKRALKHFYPEFGYGDTHGRPITCFPEEIDRWLLKNCPIPWVVEYIKDQYGIKD